MAHRLVGDRERDIVDQSGFGGGRACFVALAIEQRDHDRLVALVATDFGIEQRRNDDFCRHLASGDDDRPRQFGVVVALTGCTGDVVVDRQIPQSEGVGAGDRERRCVARFVSHRVGRLDRNRDGRSVKVAADEVDQSSIFVSVFQRDVHFVEQTEFAPRTRLARTGEDVLRVQVDTQLFHAVQQSGVDFSEPRRFRRGLHEVGVWCAVRAQMRTAFVGHEVDLAAEFFRVLLCESDMSGLRRKTPRHRPLQHAIDDVVLCGGLVDPVKVFGFQTGVRR